MKSLIILCLSLAMMACGTDSGNPGATFPANEVLIPAYDLIGGVVCQKLSACNPTFITFCNTKITQAANFGTGFGLPNPAAYPTLGSIMSAIDSKALSVTATEKTTCQAAITAMSCSNSLVAQAYSSSHLEDLSSVYKLLSVDSSCQRMVH